MPGRHGLSKVLSFIIVNKVTARVIFGVSLSIFRNLMDGTTHIKHGATAEKLKAEKLNRCPGVGKQFQI
jgi:hypothetical protein